jgi:hypothetical protein
MSGFNMPPGVSPSDIPGNGPHDGDMEEAELHCIEELAKHVRDPEDYALVLAVGIAAIQAARRLRDQAISDALVEY